MNFNINDLRLFISSAEYGNLTKAAMLNNTVQSNVSARIKYLEKELKVKLFDRTTRNIELTEEGIQFLRVAKSITESLNNFEQNLNNKTTVEYKPIKLGSTQTTAAIRISPILNSFLREHSEIELQLKTANSNSLIKEVLSFKLDGAFINGNVLHPDIEVQTIVTEELCIVFSTMYPSLEKLKTMNNTLKLVVFNKGCSYRDKFSEIITELNFQKFKYMEMDTLEGIINAVENGIGISLLPKELITKIYSHRGIKIITLPKHLSNVETVFIKRKDFPANENYLLFYDIAIKGYSVNMF